MTIWVVFEVNRVSVGVRACAGVWACSVGGIGNPARRRRLGFWHYYSHDHSHDHHLLKSIICRFFGISGICWKEININFHEILQIAGVFQVQRAGRQQNETAPPPPQTQRNLINYV